MGVLELFCCCMNKNLEDWLYKTCCKKGKPPWNWGAEWSSVFLLLLLLECEWDARTETTCKWKTRGWFSCNPACSRAGLGHRNVALPLTQGAQRCCGVDKGCQRDSPYLFPCKIGCPFLRGKSHFLEYQEHDGHVWSSCPTRTGWGMGLARPGGRGLQGGLATTPLYLKGGGWGEGARGTRGIGWTKQKRFRPYTRKRLFPVAGEEGRGAGCSGRLCRLHPTEVSAEPAVAGPDQRPPELLLRLSCPAIIASSKLSLWKVAAKSLLLSVHEKCNRKEGPLFPSLKGGQWQYL